MTNERWQAIEDKLKSVRNFPTEILLPKIDQQIDKLQNLPKKVAIPTFTTIGLLLPTAVYADAALDQSPQERSKEVADFLDNNQTETAAGILMLAGVALTLHSDRVGKRNDEPGLRALRVSGPALLTAAAGSVLLNTAEINYAIPTGLAWAGSYSLAMDNVINSLQGTRRTDIRLTSLAANAGIAASGAIPFLAAADKL